MEPDPHTDDDLSLVCSLICLACSILGTGVLADLSCIGRLPITGLAGNLSFFSAGCNMAGHNSAEVLRGPEILGSELRLVLSDDEEQRGLSLHKKVKHLGVYWNRGNKEDQNEMSAGSSSPPCNLTVLSGIVSYDIDYNTDVTSLLKRSLSELLVDQKRVVKDSSLLGSSTREINATLKKYIRLMRRRNKLLKRPNCRMGKKRMLINKKISKRLRYKTLQSLWRSNRSAAACLILDGKGRCSCPIKKSTIEFAYRNLWEGSGFNYEGQKVTVLAYADELVLISNSWGGMKKNLMLLEVFLKKSGLAVNVEKCGAFFLRKEKRAMVLSNQGAWTIADKPIPMLDANGSYKYLDIKVNPIKGIVPSDPIPMLSNLLDSIGKALLKPIQKTRLLQSYALPRLTYSVDLSGTNFGLLKEADRILRSAVKKWLHLDPSTADGLLYSSEKDGGLGLVRLEAFVSTLLLRRLVFQQESDDPLCSWVAADTGSPNILKVLWKKSTGNKHVSPPMIFHSGNVPNNSHWRQWEFEKWSNLISQGKGIGFLEMIR